MRGRSTNRLTVSEAAGELGISKRSVRDLIHEGHLTAYPRGRPGAMRQTWEITRESLDQEKLRRGLKRSA